MKSYQKQLIMVGVTTVLVPIGKVVVSELLDRWQRKREAQAMEEEDGSFYPSGGEAGMAATPCAEGGVN